MSSVSYLQVVRERAAEAGNWQSRPVRGSSLLSSELSFCRERAAEAGAGYPGWSADHPCCFLLVIFRPTMSVLLRLELAIQTGQRITPVVFYELSLGRP